MFKRLGLFALLAGTCGMALLPATASAQDGYYGNRGYAYSRGDRDWDRHERREWRENERRERRAEEWREHEWREHRGYDRDWRYRNRPTYGFYYGYPSATYADPYCNR